MGSSELTYLERKAKEICAELIALQELPVSSVAKLIKKSPKWVRNNLPLIYYGPRSHHVRIVDVRDFQRRRTIWPNRKVYEQTIAGISENDTDAAK